MFRTFFVIGNASFAFDHDIKRQTGPFPKLCHLPALVIEPRQLLSDTLFYARHNSGKCIDTTPAGKIMRMRPITSFTFKIDRRGFCT
ncbi:hypothetical protein FQZ97_971270 [compost metagenome]